MPSFLHKTLRELPQIGTYENIAVVTHNTPLIQTLNMMVDKRVSALPIVDKKNKVVEVYAKFDVIVSYSLPCHLLPLKLIFLFFV